MKPVSHGPEAFAWKGERPARPRGFALVVTISLMVLLALLAVGLLGLSTIALRGSSRGEAQAAARSHPRLALAQALNALQKHAGDDRRITADASIVDGAAIPHAVGVWRSWSPEFTANPGRSAPDYEGEKRQRFLCWLVSSTDSEGVRSPEWIQQGPSGPTRRLFDRDIDGFDLEGGLIEIDTGGQTLGQMAWAVSQEATKAKLNVAGEPEALADRNDRLVAQPRPSLALSDSFGTPGDEAWDRRAVILDGNRQLELDGDLWLGEASRAGLAHVTTHSLGLLTNVVDGGLKTDLSLGFEMPREDFERPEWTGGGRTVRNPFHASSESAFDVPACYRGQRPLYAHLGPNTSGNYIETRLLQDFAVAKAQFEYPIYCAPTFDTLRSHYRTYHHLFETDDGPTVFERAMDHVAGRASRQMAAGYYPTPALPVDASETRTAIRPVMDRTLFIVSATINDDRICYMYTPVVTLWNPYNVALEIEGAVSYLWLDIPFRVKWDFWQRGSRVGGGQIHTSHIGWQFRNVGHGRSVDPYFYGAITATGAPLSEGSPNPTIRFEPGEVRLFLPASPERIEFERSASIRDRTVFMKPFESPADLNNLDGGIYMPRDPVNQSHEVSMEFFSNRGDNYPFFVTLEDATRARGRDPNHDDHRGHPIADVISRYFAQSGEGTSTQFSTPRLAYRTLTREPYPFAVLESYHRVAADPGTTASQTADLVFTNNPRQPWMTDTISNRSAAFTSQKGSTGPQYQTRMKALSGVFSDFLGGIDGRNTFYGASHDASRGRTHLGFFELPTAPMLSLAEFQHCDLSATTFAPANQFGNGWASAYVPADRVVTGGRGPEARMIDHSHLINEALWDGFFFSGAAPVVAPGSAPGDKDESFWEEPVAQQLRSLQEVIEDWVEDPGRHPLRNSRLRFHAGTTKPDDLAEELLQPQGCTRIAAHLFVDGGFNVNSTSVEAWKAVLASLRDSTFDLADGGPGGRAGETPQSRFRRPPGDPEDPWHGYRSLTDDQVVALAEGVVEEVRTRGPFLSLAEFVNRRVEEAPEGRKGAIQAAIDRTSLNRGARQVRLELSEYDPGCRDNIDPADTGTGIPGYLTQADVLQSMAPVMTVRSDTFTIRAYGAARDRSGEILAETWLEAVVQRFPEFVDPADEPSTPVSEWKPLNETFGRRFRVIRFRYLSPGELKA